MTAPYKKRGKMRILHIAAANMLTGGGERHVAELIEWQLKNGQTPALIAPGGGDLGSFAAEKKIAYYPAAIARGFSFASLNAVKDAILDFDPEIIHVHGHRAALFGRLADDQAEHRLVYTLHGIHVDTGRLSFVKLAIERFLHRFVTHFIVTASGDIEKAERLRIARADEITLVYNGIPLRSDEETARLRGQFRQSLEGRGVSDETVLILHVGRLDAQKDQPSLIHATSLITSERDWHLAMICPGEDAMRAKMQALIDEYDLSDRVSLLPAMSDISAAYIDADVFVLSSLWEGTPYSLLEAMQAECAIVATAVGGIPEAIEDGISGMVTEIRDARAIGEGLELMVEDELLRKTYAAQARAIALERYTLDAMARAIQDCYEMVRARKA